MKESKLSVIFNSFGQKGLKLATLSVLISSSIMFLSCNSNSSSSNSKKCWFEANDGSSEKRFEVIKQDLGVGTDTNFYLYEKQNGNWALIKQTSPNMGSSQMDYTFVSGGSWSITCPEKWNPASCYLYVKDKDSKDIAKDAKVTCDK